MLRVFGAVEIDGRPALRSRHQRVVLSALVIDLGGIVSADRLIDLVWGDDLPANPGASLQSHVSRLRPLLPPGTSIEAVGNGYRLEADPSDIDVTAFETAFRAACTADAAERVTIVDDALGLWHGPPYGELVDDDRGQAEIARLESVRQGLGEIRAEALLDTGNVHAAIGDLEARRREDPLRERTTALLMRAYVAAGRKSDALAEYQRLRLALVEELGLDPSPELQDLERAILADQLPPADGRADHTSTSRATDRGPAADRSLVTLPTSSFVGRDGDVEATIDAIAASRVVSLVGPGGVGKTRLALHVADRCAAERADGVVVVELVAVRDRTRLGDAIASELDLQPRAGVSADDLVLDALERRDLLLVLDNCEHVIDAAAEFTERVTRRAAGVTVLTTSREPLNIDGEQVLRIRPLRTRDEASVLFADRARSHDRSFTLDDHSQPLVERICEALDGLPLAIELAAARVGAMSLAEILDGLDDGFVVLAHGRRTAHERHRSLGALVEWSVRSLDEPLLEVLRRVSVFVAPFTPSAAADVVGRSEPAVLAAIADLVDRSLLVEHRADGAPTRYGFLETIRAFAHELLDDSTDATAIREWHLGWALEQVEAARALMPDQNDLAASSYIMTILPDVRVAHRHFLESGDADRALRLTAALHFLAFFRLHAEMLGWIVETADRFGDTDHPLAEDVLASASMATWLAGDLVGAAAYARRAEEWAAADEHPGAGRGTAESLGDVLQFGGDNPAALRCFLRARDLARTQGDTAREATNSIDAAMVAGYLGDVEAACTLIDAARAIITDHGSHLLRTWCSYGEGEALAEHDATRAEAALTRALDLADAASLHFITGAAGLTLTGLQIRSSDPRAAVARLVDLLVHWQRSGSHLQESITLRTVVDLLLRLERFEAAATVLGAVMSADGGTAASGADAARLDLARATVVAALPDAPARLEHGAGLDLDEVVAFAVRCLRDSAPELTAD
jgi:predicted ATPase/DNA-binding SARP family transcriptional activator